MLTEVGDGVWVRQSEWVWTNSTVVRGDQGLIVVDPGIEGAELEQLADDVEGLGIPVVAGFHTHPHWDHLLWHPRFGEVPRYGTADCAEVAGANRERAQASAAEEATGVPLDLVAIVDAAARGRRPAAGRDHRAPGARRRPRRGPARRPGRPARRRHALRRPDPALRPPAG